MSNVVWLPLDCSNLSLQGHRHTLPIFNNPCIFGHCSEKIPYRVRGGHTVLRPPDGEQSLCNVIPRCSGLQRAFLISQIKAKTSYKIVAASGSPGSTRSSLHSWRLMRALLDQRTPESQLSRSNVRPKIMGQVGHIVHFPGCSTLVHSGEPRNAIRPAH